MNEVNLTTNQLLTQLRNWVVNDQMPQKEDVIDDLATIRAGAAAGATAYQLPQMGVPNSDLAGNIAAAKLAGDIPATKLAQAVQAILAAAETALQPADLTELNNRVAALEELINSGGTVDIDDVINKFNEIVDFLAGIPETTLAAILQGISEQLATKYVKPTGGIPASDLAIDAVTYDEADCTSLLSVTSEAVNLLDKSGMNTLSPNTVTNNVADPDRSQALSASLENMIEHNALGYPVFSTATSYASGNVCFYDRKLWKFTAAHQGAWNVSHVREFTLKEYMDALTARIDELYAAGVKMSLSISPSVIYKGVGTSITLTGTMSGGTPTSMAIMDGNTQLKTSSSSPITHSMTVNLSESSKTYKVVGEYLDRSFNSTSSVSARYPLYYGFGANAAAVAIDANKYAPTTSAVRTYTKTASTNGQHFYLLVPNDITPPTSFVMGGAPFVMSRTTQTINGVPYVVFESGNVYNSGTELKVTAA